MNYIPKLFYGSNIFGKVRYMSSIPATKQKVDFFYDVISGYSWFAFEMLQRYKTKWNIDLNLVPVLLGGIFRNAGNVSPLASPFKVKMLESDLKSCAKYYDVDLKPLEEISLLLKTGSLVPMRCLAACEIYYPEHLESISRALWIKRWQQDQDFNNMEALIESIKFATKNSKNDLVPDLLAKMQCKEVKEKLLFNTNTAVEKYGIFGVPSMVVHKEGNSHELYFGADRVVILANELGVKWDGPNPK